MPAQVGDDHADLVTPIAWVAGRRQPGTDLGLQVAQPPAALSVAERQQCDPAGRRGVINRLPDKEVEGGHQITSAR
jgi:hypothetical protein